MFCLFFLGSCASTGGTVGSDSFSGSVMYAMVYDMDGKPVQYASVYVNGEMMYETDSQGRFVVEGSSLQSPEMEIRIEKPFYRTVLGSIRYNPLGIAYFRTGNSEQYFSEAEKFMGEKMYGRALENIEHAIELQPGRKDYGYMKAVILQKMNRSDEAREVLSGMSEGNFDIYVKALGEKLNGN